MKTFKFSLVLRTRENTDVFITLDDNIYGIHSKRVDILYIQRRVNVDVTPCHCIDVDATLSQLCMPAGLDLSLRQRFRHIIRHLIFLRFSQCKSFLYFYGLKRTLKISTNVNELK